MRLLVVKDRYKTEQVHHAVGNGLGRRHKLLFKVIILNELVQSFEVTNSSGVLTGRRVLSTEPVKYLVLEVLRFVEAFDIGHEMLLSSEYISLYPMFLLGRSLRRLSHSHCERVAIVQPRRLRRKIGVYLVMLSDHKVAINRRRIIVRADLKSRAKEHSKRGNCRSYFIGIRNPPHHSDRIHERRKCWNPQQCNILDNIVMVILHFSFLSSLPFGSIGKSSTSSKILLPSPFPPSFI
nr:MAG TPA: hypothetical protein [Caudoviricetes sp.]